VSSDSCTKGQEQELEVARVAQSFEIKVGVHQGSCLSSLLLIIVLDVVH